MDAKKLEWLALAGLSHETNYLALSSSESGIDCNTQHKMEVVLRRATLLRHHLNAALQAQPTANTAAACQEASQAILAQQLLVGEQQGQQQTGSHQRAVSAAQQHAQAVEAWCSGVVQQLRKVCVRTDGG